MSNDGAVSTLPPPYDPAIDVPDLAIQPATRRGIVMSVSGLVTSALIAVLTIMPAPYAIGKPGPTFDTLGEVRGLPLVTVEGAEVFEPTGELRLTTVSVSKGTSQQFTLGAVLRGWLSDSQYVLPEEDVFGTPEESEEFEQASQEQWITSQESAAVAALEQVGVEVPAEMYVALVSDESNALNVLDVDDQIIALNGERLDTFADLSTALGRLTPGEVIDLTISRDGIEQVVSFATVESADGRALMGIYVAPIFDLPIDVTVAIDSVGGPSAGLMFSLAIVDLLTEGDATNGELIAGTGGIDADGNVFPIGGIRLKMYGAVAAGSEYFLAPRDNCSEVAGHIPDGLHVVSVATLDEAYDAVVSIGAGDANSLPTC